MLNERRANSDSLMACLSIKQKWASGGNISLVLKDDLGQIRTGFGVTYTGMVRRGLDLGPDEDFSIAINRDVIAHFNCNGVVDALKSAEDHG